MPQGLVQHFVTPQLLDATLCAGRIATVLSWFTITFTFKID
jgi:hypothetical protein